MWKIYQVRPPAGPHHHGRPPEVPGGRARADLRRQPEPQPGGAGGGLVPQSPRGGVHNQWKEAPERATLWQRPGACRHQMCVLKLIRGWDRGCVLIYCIYWCSWYFNQNPKLSASLLLFAGDACLQGRGVHDDRRWQGHCRGESYHPGVTGTITEQMFTLGLENF